jgi:TAG lipase/steryl ester hydrolase/phospholipase A2/LPA acyltransferase
MSLFSDALLSGGSTRLHIAEDGHVVCKSKSHGSFLAPLTKLVRDPVQTLGNAIGSHYDTPFQSVADEVTNQKQILYLRLKNVRTLIGVAAFTC